MASTARSAVSDYEYLKFRFWNEHQGQNNESDEEDILPLKAKANPHSLSFQNANHINKFPYSTEHMDEESIDSIQQVPTPSVWSPGMNFRPNPSLFITPEKQMKGSLSKLHSERDILEPQDLNKVPQPAAWSPHPLLKPSVLITPEKLADSTSNLKNSATHKSAFQSDTAKSVRFRLPSSSSADECMNSSAVSDSLTPITVNGKELDTSREVSFPSKAYDPMIYSDDSVLDDSTLDIRQNMVDSDSVSSSTSANLVDKLNQLLVSSESSKDEKNSSRSVVLAKFSQSKKSSGSSEAPITSKKSLNKKVTDDRNVKSKKASTIRSNYSNSHSHSVSDIKSGPHHLSSSISPYYPPNSGACVVREAKHPMVSTEYSYPFHNVEDTHEYEHIFCRPEFNSTLKVRTELDNLCDQDVGKPVEIKLSKSSVKKTEIQEKAAIYTNHVYDQFTNLVDVEPSVDRLCDRIVRMRTNKSIIQKKGAKQQKKISTQKEPDLMEFYSADLQKESPDLSLPGISPNIPGLINAPHQHAFDCYRHNRVWHGLRDF